MKKFLFAIGAISGLAVLGMALWLGLFMPRSNPAPDIQVEMSPENIERGRYLAINVLQCVDCHSERAWNLYGGPPVCWRDAVPS
jgi:hypothetical protein